MISNHGKIRESFILILKAEANCVLKKVRAWAWQRGLAYHISNNYYAKYASKSIKKPVFEENVSMLIRVINWRIVGLNFVIVISSCGFSLISER